MAAKDYTETKPAAKQVLRLCMPSKGDMEILGQEGSVIDLAPIFYGTECMGPHVQVLEGHDKDGKFVVDNVVGRYKLKLKADGRVELKRAQ
jgi:hypothetical protein